MPTLLEKPIAPTVSEAELIVRAADAAKATLLIGHHRAHSPIMASAKRVIEEGRLGPLVAVIERRVLQARPLFRRWSVASPAGRRSNPAQHDPRGAQPAHAVRRDRRGAGLLVERDTRVCGGGHSRHQPAFRRRRARHLHALRYRRVRAPAGEQTSEESKAYRATPTKTATSSRAPRARSRCRRCG